MRSKKLILWSLGLSLSALFGVYLSSGQLTSEETEFTSSVAHVLFRNNFHPVVEGKVYRAAEMSERDLRKTIEENKIRTVLDMRLGNAEAFPNVHPDQIIAEESGATHVRFQLRGSRVPTKESLRALLKLFDSVELPLLLHCTSGTHRSGVVSALWLLEKEGIAPEIAAKQLAPRYGYFRKERELKSFFQGHPTIDHLIWMYLEYAERRGGSFREWLDVRDTL